jgi:effector-binding domain-containing protein
MKILKTLLYVLLILVVLYLVLCATGSKEFDTKKSIAIKASSERVFQVVSDFNMFEKWSPWSKKDASIKQTITGEPGKVGHKMEWTSQKMGAGSQEISAITEPAMGSYEITDVLAMKDWDQSSTTKFIIEEKGDSTTVTWTMDSPEIPFLMRGMMVVFGAQKAIEEDYTNGLKDLKALVESMPEEQQLDMEIIEIPEVWYVGKRMLMNESKIDSSLFATTFMELGKAIGGMDKMAGPPMSISHNYNEQTKDMDIEIAIPVKAEMPTPAELHCGKIPAGKCAKYVYIGPYEESSSAWMPFYEQTAKKHKIRFAGYEVYANDPGSVGYDKSKYETWLMIPIE